MFLIVSTECNPGDIVDAAFWNNETLELYQDVLNVAFEPPVGTHSFVHEPRMMSGSLMNISELDAAKTMKSVAEELVEQRKSTDSAANIVPNIQQDDKYDKLYREYIELRRERDELKAKLTELEIRYNIMQKNESAVKPPSNNNVVQSNQTLIIAGAFLLLGMIFPKLLRFLID